MEPRARLVKTRKSAPEKPVTYTEDLGKTVCGFLAKGYPLAQVGAMPDMPDMETIAGWVLDDVEGFASQFERARQIRAMVWEDEVLQIADDNDGDWKETARGMTANSDHIQRAKLRVDVRKWLLGKWLPKQFGDKLGLSSDEDNPMTVTIVRYGDDPITE